MPSELQYCRINDPNLGRCLTKAFNTVIRSAGNGSAAYGVKPLELLEVPYLEFSMGAGNVSADIRLKNVAIKGLSKINVMTVNKLPVHASQKRVSTRTMSHCEGRDERIKGSRDARRLSFSEMTLLVILCFAVVGTQGLDLPPYVKPCPRNDPSLEECILKNGQEAAPFIIRGDPQYGMFVMDPWHPKDIHVKEFGLSLAGFNLTIIGYKGGHLESVKIDPSKNKVTIKYRIPEIFYTGKYDMNGRLVAIPVRGNGDFVVNMYDTVIKYTTDFKVIKKSDGEEYAVPQSYDFVYFPGDMKMNLTNLFGGNKLIGDVMNKFMNDNWRAVMDEAGKPSTRAMGQELHQVLTNVCDKIPLSKIFT